MSAGAPIVYSSLSLLAPKMAAAVQNAIQDCKTLGLDPVVHESFRSNELQEMYWRRGRPPTPEYPKPVTNAKSNLYSWHGYGLAVDIISSVNGWFNVESLASFSRHGHIVDRLELQEAYDDYKKKRIAEGEAWFAEVARIFELHELDWGGHWRQRDLPHFQWGTLRPTPSNKAREMILPGETLAERMTVLWKFVGAV